MKNKKTVCIIAILCVITCALSVMLTACTLIKMIGGSDDDDNKKFDFNAITENDWKGEELTEEQWKNAFDPSSFKNVTVYVGKYDDTARTYSSSLSYYFDLNSQKVGAYDETDIKYGAASEMRFFVENNKVYSFEKMPDEKKTTDRNHVSFLWVKSEEEDMSTESLNEAINEISFPFLKECYSYFEYKDGAYCPKNTTTDSDNQSKDYQPSGYNANLKITFRDGKLFLISVPEDNIIIAYRDFGKTKVSLPKDFVDEKDFPDFDNISSEHNHIDENNNDLCDECLEPICKEHVDKNNDLECDWCDEDLPCIEHKDKNNDGWCDLCGKHVNHLDDNNDGHCDKCWATMSEE